jgi:hypothetical protein
MYKYILIFVAVIYHFLQLQAQNTSVLIATISDKNTKEPLTGANLELENLNIGAVADIDGKIRLDGIPVGNHNIVVTYLGYKTLRRFNQSFTSGNAVILNLELEEESTALGEVSVTALKKSSIGVADIITPLSVQSLTTDEIKSNPGGNFDISRVIQVLPGVGGTAGSVGGFRNDIIIRGGAPNENVFYLDGIEIPVINHFATQGSAGGPTGILNVSFIEDVKLSSSAFDARYDNALASVFEFKQRAGNPERFSGNARLSATEFALTGEGPVGDKVTYLASARRSYLQLLFQAIDLPILPNYWDFQYKVQYKPNSKTTINFIGVGAIDEFRFTEPRNSSPEKEFILRSSPNINQWNYTTGVGIRRLIKGGFVNVALSRNMLDNRIDRFEDRQEGNEAFRILGLQSQEIENKLRVDVNKIKGNWRYSYGIMAQYVKFNTDIFSRVRNEIRDPQGNLIQPQVVFNYDSAIDFFRYGGFAQVARTFWGDKLSVAAGIRSDMNSFTSEGNNPLETLSPRISASYAFLPRWRLNASVGSYYKIPIYTVLGFRNEAGEFVNRDNAYIRSTHYTGGTEFIPNSSWRFTLEGFYKDYGNYPISVLDGISLANQGGDFGSIGNEKVVSDGVGRAFGFEVYGQRKFSGKIYAVLSYTYVRSEFSGFNGVLVPSAWDSRHIISGLVGRKFDKGWEMGLKYRFAAGAPFTPFDLEASRLNYASLGVGILDFSQLNTQRLANFNQFDFRLDKKWNFRKWTLDVFLDIQNAFVQPNPAFPNYTFERNTENTGWLTSDGGPLLPDGSNAVPLILNNVEATVVPSIGFIIEW